MKRTTIFKTNEGYVGAIVLQPEGFYCGYVGIPHHHRLYGFDYSTLTDIDVHGDLTYGRVQSKPYHYPTKDEKYDGLFFFGFDAHHFTDKIHPELVLGMKEEFSQHELNLAKMALEIAYANLEDENATFKTFDFIKEQVESLSRQLKERE